MTEITKEWKDLSPFQIICCLAAHATPLGLDHRNARHMKTMRRIFDLGEPRITLTYIESQIISCRIDDVSVGVMNVLIKQYL
jgi:hypothetical protein